MSARDRRQQEINSLCRLPRRHPSCSVEYINDFGRRQLLGGRRLTGSFLMFEFKD
jgi:hypothetical protein